MANDFPSSDFDPALHLHSEPPEIILQTEPDLDSFADDIEALQQRRLEIAEENRRKGVVIQHRSWNLSDVFRSDDDIQPLTPTKSLNYPQLGKGLIIENFLPSTPPTAMAPSISAESALTPSPSLTDPRKRKLESTLPEEDLKRQKIVVDNQLSSLQETNLDSNDHNGPRMIGGFIDDDDDDDEDALAELGRYENGIYSFQNTEYGKQTEKSLPENVPNQKTHGPFVEDEDEEEEDSTNALRDTSANSDATLLRMMSNSAPIISLGSDGTSLERGKPITIKTCSGKTLRVQPRQRASAPSYERIVASRSKTAAGKAQRSYYGIEIHRLLDHAASEIKEDMNRKREQLHIEHSIETPVIGKSKKNYANPMWTEKYRARRFADLIGDERTHRSVLRWLKGWDPVVFPGLARSKPMKTAAEEGERIHRKILMLAGPPGLGKTTLAHVCAQQAGYEVLEINASDERSRDVVKGRIRDAVGTENVKSVSVNANSSKAIKPSRPVCVVVDEVDGVVGGSGSGGEGGFIKALIDLVMTDQKNSARTSEIVSFKGKRRKGDDFRLLRPIILICNDAYHSSLRPLRTSSIAEVIHVRQVPMENVIQRLKIILTKENIQYDGDGVRRLCEASWGMTAKKDRTEKNRGVGEGDIRSILVSAEWVVRKLRAFPTAAPRLTKRWLEENILNDAQSSGYSKGLGRGGVREITDRVFIEGAGFPLAPIGIDSFNDPFDQEKTKTPVGVAELRRRHAASKLREMIDASGDYDRCITDCFTEYPTRTFQDDTFLSKPNSAYDWLQFHDMISSKVFSNQDWELNPYLSQSILAFHHLFASATSSSNKRKFEDENTEEEDHPFSGPRADFAAFEALKQNKSTLVSFQSTFSAPLMRLFRSVDCVATDLVPNLVRMLSPDIKPVVVRGSDQSNVASVRKESEKALVLSAVKVMGGLGVTFERVRVGNEGSHTGWVYRMEPPIDTLICFSKTKGTILDTNGAGPVRYAIRQVLDQEYRKETLRKQGESSQAKMGLPSSSSNKDSKQKQTHNDDDKENGSKTKSGADAAVNRDFFGRVIQNNQSGSAARPQNHKRKSSGHGHDRKVWVTFHEGFSNAVRKPVSMAELLAEL
ncbi:Chromosome transmission fidelity protein 18 [Talaromyces atroroseus]|uniref:Chromosome transmission fidelity protein 18 n=1 Tax=Talaromyces atroroseus TaxID=1441469 RepID=A0A225AV42_TALAT|nr:Chromosome transmission fidelity protein 18 [Talaromyces atroroseus]OKL62254.1 Chromosome transmission fidelity protein 18 [Talaromyces atroroseus]